MNYARKADMRVAPGGVGQPSKMLSNLFLYFLHSGLLSLFDLPHSIVWLF